MRTLVIALALAPVVSVAQPRPEEARSVFALAEAISREDDQGLWGVSLHGPVIVADPETRIAFASRRAPNFKQQGDVWTGNLPDSIGISNTAFDWVGTRWTMLRWPIPEDAVALRRLLAHELWHRIQQDIGFRSTGPANEHLGTRDGRYWLVLEMRALKSALETRYSVPVQDALAFRAERHRLFKSAAEEERLLMNHEGLAQYTGLALSGLDPGAARTLAALDLDRADSSDSFSRSFAYWLGGAYGLLLHSYAPDWTHDYTVDSTMAATLARTLGLDPTDLRSAEGRYGHEELAAREDAREAARLAKLAEQERRYITGPRLLLPFHQMNVSFDPGQIDILQGHGGVYRSMTLTDDWGSLKVSGGALIKSDWSGVILPAPVDRASPIKGDGYVLELSDGWELAQGEESNLLVARKRD